MITTIKHSNLTWVNLESPSAKEISGLANQFSIHPLIAEELISPTLRPKADVYKDNLYLILHFPVFNLRHQINSSCEIDFVIGKDFLITAQYGCLDTLESFIKEAQMKEDFREKHLQNHAGFLAFYIIKDLYEFSLRQLDHIQIKITKVEEQIFTGGEKEMVKKLSLVKRDILDFRRTIYPHGAVLSSFEKSGKEFFGEDFGHYLSVLIGEYAKVKNLIDGCKEIIEALNETNESLLSTKTNEIMKTLTIMAFITFPLMLFSGIFGMNTVATPLIGLKGDFWMIIIIMLLATVSMFFFFKRKKWL